MKTWQRLLLAAILPCIYGGCGSDRPTKPRALPFIMAADYPTLQAAVDDLPAEGGTVYLPAGVTDITSYAPLILKWGTRLIGQGSRGWVETITLGPSVGATQIKCTDANKNIIEVKDAGYCSLENFDVVGPNSAGTGIGIKAYWSAPQDKVPSLNINNVTVEKCGSHGVTIDNCYMSNFVGLRCWGNRGDGLRINEQSGPLTNPTMTFTNCLFVDNVGWGAYLDDLQWTDFLNCVFQNNGIGQCYLEDSSGIGFAGCDFELIDAGSTKVGIKMIRVGSVTIARSFFSCSMNPGAAATGVQCLYAHDCTFEENVMQTLETSGANDGVAYGLFADGGSLSTRNCIGRLNLPAGHIKPIGGTEGSDFTDLAITFTQQFANDAARDAALSGTNLNPPFKVKGQIIYVLSPTAPTNKLQYWDGSAWQNV